MSSNKRERTHKWADPAALAESKISVRIRLFECHLHGEIPQAPIAETLDFHPVSLAPGKIVFEFQPQEYHYNPIGSVHGGVISTLLDTVMGCAVQSRLPRGTAYTTLELKVNFIKVVSSKSGRMIAEGRIIHLGRSTALVEADLKDEQGKTYAHGTSTCMIFKF